MVRSARLVITFILLAVAAPALAQQAPLVDRELFFGDPAISGGQISPDGQWLAYESNASGRFEVYVRPFPDVDAGGLWQISTTGGTRPLWGPDGRELFYRHRGEGVSVMPVDPGPPLRSGIAELIVASYVSLNFSRNWDVSSDGERLLIVKAGAATSDAEDQQKIVWVQNWHEELKRLVPPIE